MKRQKRLEFIVLAEFHIGCQPLNRIIFGNSNETCTAFDLGTTKDGDNLLT